MRWVIQSNLINSSDHDRMVDVCRANGFAHESVRVAPFESKLPEIPADMPTVFYGGTNFINQVHQACRWSPGAFFNENFSYKEYFRNYGSCMLGEPEFTTIQEFSSSHRSSDELFFIRPNADLKLFAGQVMSFDEIVKWEKLLRLGTDCSKHPGLTPETEVVVSPPFSITHEWRLFMVAGLVSSGSHYRSKHQLDVYAEVPAGVVIFAENVAALKWVPDHVFVMDIGESAGNLYIIECNCFNSAGFYAADISKIMGDVSDFVSGWY